MTVHRTRGSRAAGAMAVYTYTGDDLPLTDPVNHLPALLFHSTFNYYAAASGFPLDVPVNHVAIAPDAGTVQGPVTSYDSIVENDYPLATHGLGYKPNFMVAINGVEYPAGCPVQIGAYGARRSLCYWVDTTKIYVKESCRPSIPGLPAISLTHHVTVFRDPASVAGAPLFKVSLAGGRGQIGFGRLDTNERNMREPDTGETTYTLAAGGQVNFANGRTRWALADGSVFTVGPILGLGAYNGSFFGGKSKKVAV